MDTILDRPRTTESFLAWEDRQEFKYEFDGQRVIPMTGGSIAHQRIVANVWLALLNLLGDRPLMAGRRCVCASGHRSATPMS